MSMSKSKTNTAVTGDTTTINGGGTLVYGGTSGYGIVGSGGGGLGSGVSGTSGGILTSYPSSTITLTQQNYAVFKLPIKDKVPNKVYVAGRLVNRDVFGEFTDHYDHLGFVVDIVRAFGNHDVGAGWYQR